MNFPSSSCYCVLSLRFITFIKKCRFVKSWLDCQNSRNNNKSGLRHRWTLWWWFNQCFITSNLCFSSSDCVLLSCAVVERDVWSHGRIPDYLHIIQAIELLLKHGAVVTIDEPLSLILNIDSAQRRDKETYETVDYHAFNKIIDDLGEIYRCFLVAGS